MDTLSENFVGPPVPLRAIPGVTPETEAQARPNPTDVGGPQYKNIKQGGLVEDIGQQESGERAEGIRPTPAQKWTAGWDLTSHDSPIGLPGSTEPGALTRWLTHAPPGGGSQLSADQANAMYPDRPVPYNAPVDPWVASQESASRQRIARLQEWKSRGAATPWTDFAQGLGGGLDPLYLILGWGVGGTAMKGLAGLGVNFGKNLAVTATGAAVTGAIQKSEGESVTFGQKVQEAVSSAAFGTGLHYVLRGLFGEKDAQARKEIQTASPEEVIRRTKEQLVQLERGNKVDSTPQQMVTEQKLLGSTQTPQGIQPSQGLSDGYWMAAKSDGTRVQLDDQLGPGTSLTNDPNVANNLAADPNSEIQGHVASTDLPVDSKLLNIDEPLNRESEIIKKAEEKTGLPISDLLKDGDTIKDVLHSLSYEIESGTTPPEAMNQIQEAAKEAGYSGYESKNTDTGAHEVHLFDENHPVKSEFQANPDLVPRITSDQQKSIDLREADSSRSELADPVRDQQIHEMRKYHPPEMDEMTKLAADQYIEAKEALSKSDLKFSKSALEELKRLEATEKQTQAAVEKMIECATEGVVE